MKIWKCGVREQMEGVLYTEVQQRISTAQDLCHLFESGVMLTKIWIHAPVIIKSASALLSISVSNNLSALACDSEDLR